MRRASVAGLAVLSYLGTASTASGQAQTGAPTAPQIERFVLRPSVAVTDVGLDTNVLTTASGQQRDRTANLRVQADPSLRLGPARLSGTVGARLSYFQVHDTQRSIDADQSVRVDVLSRRLSTYALASFVRAHDPFDPEVYTRTQRVQHAVEGGATYRVTGKTSADFTAQRTTMSLQAADTGLGGGRAEKFSRQTESFTGAVHNALTTLTTVSALVGVRQEHAAAPVASDATSVSLTAGLDTKPDAFIAGNAYAGYRQFRSGNAAGHAPGGIVASMDAGVEVTDSIRIGALLHRDVSRSFTVADTYLTTTRLGARVTKRISPAWTLRAETSRQWLTYDSALPPAVLDSAIAVLETTVDRMVRYTVEPEYQFGRATSIVFTADYYALQAHASGQRYDRLRLVSSITHRF
jgi:hypothetical protein